MGIPPHKTNVITDRLLRSWIRCKRKAWLDRYGDEKKRVWTAHRALQLDHQQRSFAELITREKGKGLKACEIGFEGVMGIRLKGLGPSGELIEAHPPLLQRIKGESRWGKFAYRPVLARQGRKVTREHRLGLTFSGILLEQLQESKVSSGLLVTKGNQELEIQKISLSVNLQQQLLEVLKKIKADLQKDEPPTLISDRRKCTLCCWKGVCNVEATAEGHLSEVSGIGPKRKQILQELGINKLQELATSNPRDLGQKLFAFGVQHSEIADQIVAQARVQHNGSKERLSRTPALPELIDAPGILIYDIESDPDARDDFLHGFIRLMHKKDDEWDLEGAKYQPILAPYEHGKPFCWERINRKLTIYKDWPVLHYGETEVTSLLRLAKQQGVQKQELSKLRARFIDIHDRLRLHWRLPINSYGLKTVANWTGFQWHQKGADGARALLWWRQWHGTDEKNRGNSKALKWLFKYNQDDCLATWAVAKWLLKQDSFLP